MLQTCSYRELRRDNMQISPYFQAPCKLQILHPSFNSIIFQGFYSTNNEISTRVYLGFNFTLQIRPKTQHFRIRNSSSVTNSVNKYNTNKKKKKYGGLLPSILRSLDSDDDVDKTLNLYYGKLNPKEQTVILKEQRNWERVVKVFEWMKSQPDYIPNVIHYNVVLRVLGRARKWDDLRLCWIEMAKKGVLPTNNTYGMLVDVYGKAGLVKEALLWIKHMKLRAIFPDEVTMNTVVRVLKDGGEYDRADRFYKDWCNGKVELDDLELDSMADSESGVISLKHFLLTELFRTGGRDHSKSFGSFDLEKSVHKPRLTATYNTLIDLYGKAGRLKDAADVFSEMLKSGVAIDTITFNTMIFTCGSHGNLSEAEALMKEMEERGIRPDTKTYNIFLSLYADSGDIDRALKCYRKIREVGLRPDVVTHRAVIQILCERKMVFEVENVIEEMEKFGLCIDKQSLPVVIKMYLDEGLNDCAKFLFEKCQKNGGLNSKIYAAIIDAYAQKGLWAEAESVFFCERDFVLQKDIVEYNVMIKAYGMAKLYDKAFLLFKGMKSQGNWPDECTYNSLIQMFAGGDLVDEARDLLAETKIAGFKPSCLSFSAVIASYSRLNRLSEAEEIYQEMVKDGVKPNEVVFGSLINGFAESGELEEALRFFKIMEEFKISPNQVILTSLIKAYSKTGVVEGARLLYKKLNELEEGPDIVASNSMLNLYADLGMVSEAQSIFDDLIKKNEADGVSCASMMYLYKNMGMLEEAMEVAEEMRRLGLLTDCTSYNKAMACYATNGRLLECGEMLHEMITRKIVLNNGTFKVLFTVLKKGNLPVEGVRQLEFAFQESQSQSQSYASQAVITAVFSVVGLQSFALKFCENFMKLEKSLDLFAYNVAIYVFGASGKINEALRVFMKMQDEGLEADVVTYIYLVGCYGEGGMIEGVKRIYSQLKYGEIDPNESLFRAVKEAYEKVNRHDLAELVNQEMNLAFDPEILIDSENEEDPDQIALCSKGEITELGTHSELLSRKGDYASLVCTQRLAFE